VIDLHCHSTVSDGTDTPTELVEIARSSGVRAIAVTDHDTLDHVDEARQAGAERGVRVVPACELSCTTPAGVGTMHLLVYFPDVRSALADALADLRRARDERNVVIVERLRDAGVPAAEVGETGGDRLVASGAFDVALADATRAWRDAIPNALGVTTSH
jgi:predicted metal-dependent phosphoesterase TrpH